MKLPDQRWLTQVNKEATVKYLTTNGVPGFIAPLLLNRGIGADDYHDAWDFLDPDGMSLPNPLDEFPGLSPAVNWLSDNPGKIGICGDYDTDGMTSTALLLRLFKHLGMPAQYEIPSRLQEGYGINERIVRDFADAGVKTIITVDNGISAHKPIALAKQLGLKVIVTDHHELPQTLPDATIINPKMLSESSHWRGLAGVGVAYILGISLARVLGKTAGIADQLWELFTIGTIADMVPLIGVNRKFVIGGLKKLSSPKVPGIQALTEVAEIKGEIKPEDIGFKLAPYINAVGRIGDPKIVLDLFTADTLEDAIPYAKQCQSHNIDRQELTVEIEKEALAAARKTSYKDDCVLALFNPHWHSGVIGIVASRLVERLGVPVFLMTEVDDNKIRGSARGVEGFNVYEALQFCQSLLATFGGHKAAGGFSLYQENLQHFKEDLRAFALNQLKPSFCKPIIKLDGQIPFSEINLQLIETLEKCQPWGIENREPIFWTSNCRILETKAVKGGHRSFWLQHGSHKLRGIAWRWADYELPEVVDLAYKLKLNTWNEKTNIQLEIVGARIPTEIYEFEYEYGGETLKYSCSFDYNSNELTIINSKGTHLFVELGNPIAQVGPSRTDTQSRDMSSHTIFFEPLLKLAYQTLGIVYAT